MLAPTPTSAHKRVALVAGAGSGIGRKATRVRVANGSVEAEARMAAQLAARAVRHLAPLPLEANGRFLRMMPPHAL